MNDLNVIDQFTSTFVTYIGSGFGLLGPDVAFLTTVLIGIDITLAGLFWALADDKAIIPSLIKKVLYVGAFAFILNNFAGLSTIIFDSFAGLGLRATGSPISAADLMRPGFVAATGYTAAEPLLNDVSDLIGPIAFFENFVTISILMFAWATAGVHQSFTDGQKAAFAASGGSVPASGGASTVTAAASGPPGWAQKLRREQRLREGATITAHTIRDGDWPAAGENPRLKDDD